MITYDTYIYTSTCTGVFYGMICTMYMAIQNIIYCKYTGIEVIACTCNKVKSLLLISEDKQLPSVLVSNRFVDLRIISSISVWLKQ